MVGGHEKQIDFNTTSTSSSASASASAVSADCPRPTALSTLSGLAHLRKKRRSNMDF
jgi:hypothetical protein